MITADIYDFYVNYTGLMTEPEMARELKIPVEELKEVKKEFAQLCWTCKNACNGRRCIWVRNGIYPPYVWLENGYITKCERYEEDA